MRDGAEPATLDARLQFTHAGVETARIGDPEHDPGARHRIQRAGGALAVQGERLFHEDGLARRRGALDLRPVLAVRGREHHRVDRRVGQHLVETVSERDAVLGAELFGLRPGAGVPGGEADRRALALHRPDQGAPPAPQPDNRRPDHPLSLSPTQPRSRPVLLHALGGGGHASARSRMTEAQAAL